MESNSEGFIGRVRRTLSPRALCAAAASLWRRFPVAVCFILAGTVWEWLCDWKVLPEDNEIWFAGIWCASLGAMLSSVVRVWAEFLGGMRRQSVLQMIVCAIVAVDFVLILTHCSWTGDDAGRVAVATALFVAVVFMPAARGASRRSMLAFSFSQIVNAARSLCLAVLMAIAVSMIVGSVGVLFDVRVGHPMVFFISSLACALPVLMFLANIPGPGAVGTNGGADRFFAGACKNVVLPLVVIYMAVLYVYALKIVIQWSLPQGSIVAMVTGLSVVVMLSLYGLQPYGGDDRNSGARRIAGLARHWLPVLMLPLLVLMSVGLIYRFSQYGPTPSRIYVALFAVWAFASMIWLIVNSNANLNVVAMSFACSFVLVSVVPGLNVMSLTTSYLRSSVKEAFARCRMPMTEAEAREALSRMPADEARLTASRLQYLDSWDDHTRVADIVASDGMLYAWKLVDDEDEAVVDASEVYCWWNGPVAVPDGFTQVEHNVLRSSDRLRMVGGRVSLGCDSISLSIPIDSLMHISDERFSPFDAYSDARTRVSVVAVDADTIAPDKAVINKLEVYIFTK